MHHQRQQQQQSRQKQTISYNCYYYKRQFSIKIEGGGMNWYNYPIIQPFPLGPIESAAESSFSSLETLELLKRSINKQLPFSYIVRQLTNVKLFEPVTGSIRMADIFESLRGILAGLLKEHFLTARMLKSINKSNSILLYILQETANIIDLSM